MGIFESIGRTNVLSESVDKLSDRVLQLREGRAKEETNRLQTMKLSHEVKALEQRERTRSLPIDVTMHPAFQSIGDEEAQKNLLTMMQEAKVVTGTIGKGGEIADFLKEMAMDPQAYERGMGPIARSKEKVVKALRGELSEMEQAAVTKGIDLSKDQKYQLKQMQAARAYEEYVVAKGGFESHLAELNKRKQETEKIRITAEEVRKTQAAKIAAMAKAGLGQGNKPTAAMRNFEYFTEQFPYADRAVLAESFVNVKGMVSESKAVEAGIQASQKARDGGEDDEELIKALGDRVREDTLKVIREINKGRKLGPSGEREIKAPAGFVSTGKMKGGKPIYFNKKENRYWVPD